MNELNLDSINTSEVSLSKVDETGNKSIEDDIPKLDELDLLVDPTKSIQNTPSVRVDDVQPDKSNSTDTNLTSTFKDTEISEKKTLDNVEFKINVERETTPNTNDDSTIKKFTTMSSSLFEDDGKERQELLFKLKRLEARGIPLSKHYSNSSSVSEMREEYSRLKQQRDLENSIKFQRKTMMAFASGVEFMNSKFDPFDIKLDGWSESLHENLNDYDDVFEELHEKYKTRAKIAPEIRLLMMLGGSAVMFHMTQSFFKSSSMPNMDDIMKQNPDLARQFANAGVAEATKNSPGLGNLFNDMMNEHKPAQPPVFIPPQPSFTPPSAPSNMHAVPDAPSSIMSGPKDQDVERILNQINEYRESDAKPTKDLNMYQNQPPATPAAPAPAPKRRGRPKKNATPSFP
ncbi:MAG: hypothetical protein CML47_01915 [Rhodobacteraceae bacterium]|nr:MAG: hypothetical protein CML47_01915 [Paracoccaceae bacterium]|tara:strand:- start:3965 stop:5170 length:1206 start_codon:yes stop_codon:yes gene_type:complete